MHRMNSEFISYDLKAHDHACLIHDSEEEWRQVVIPYIVSGLQQGDKCVYLLNNREAKYVKQQIYAAGINVFAYEQNGQLLIIDKSYLKKLGAKYSTDNIINIIVEFVEQSLNEGFKSVRFTGEEFFSLFNFKTMIGEIEINKILNDEFFSVYPVIALCQYDRVKTDPELLRYAIISHPIIIIDKIKYLNPVDIFETNFVDFRDARWEAELWLNSLKQKTGAKSKLQFLAAAFERCTQPMIAIYPDGAVMTFNRALCQLLGLERKNVISVVEDAPLLSRCIDTILQKVSNQNLPYVYEDLILHEDGKLLFIEISLHKNPYGEYYYAFFSDITERKMAQDRYNLIVENAYDGITILNAYASNHHYVNPSLLKLTGYSEGEFLQKSPFQIIHPEDHDRVRAALHEGLKMGRGAAEFRLMKKDTEYLWMEVTGKVVENSGSRTELIFVSRDITERKMSEQKLKESEEKYRLIADNANDIIAIVNSFSLDIVYASTSTYKLTGYKPDDAIGRNIGDYIHPDDIGNVLRILQERRLIGDGRSELRVRKNDGSYLWVEAVGKLMKNGYPPGILLVIRDIQERKTAQDAVMLSEKRLRLITDNMSDCIVFVNREHVLEYISPSVEFITGYEPCELQGKPKIDQYHPEDRKRLIVYWIEMGKTSITSNIEFRFQHKKGHYIWLEAAGKTLWENDRYQGMVLNVRDINHRKLTENRLKKSEENYRLIADNSQDMISIICSHTYAYLYVSPSKSRVLGYSQEYYLNSKLPDFIYPKDKDYVLRILQESIARGVGSGEFRFRKQDGSYMWLETVGRVIHGRDETLLVSRDINERKLAEEALKKSEYRLRQIAENMNDGIIVLNIEKGAAYISPSFKNMLGYENEYLHKINRLSLVHPEDRTKINCFSEQILMGNTSRLEYRVRHIDGHYVWLESAANPLIGEDGTVNEVVFALRDITQRKKMEQDLQEQLDYKNILIDNMNDLFYTYDKEGRFEFGNHQAKEATGYTTEEMKGKFIYEYVVEEHRELVRHSIIERMKSGETSSYEHKMTCKDGSELLVKIKAAPIILDGEITGGMVLAEDITEQRKLEKEMDRLVQLHTVGEMAASIGHEIRNPMTTVKGFLQMMMHSSDLEDYRDELDIMVEELERANSIISEFLSLARNKMITPKPNKLNDIIKAIYPLLKADAMHGDKIIILDLEEIPELLIDEKEIRQLILNLVRNGLEAVSPGGIVIIKTEVKKDHVVLKIIDEGFGIPKGIMDKLGTPFFTTKEDGTGLGLAVCYGIAERHGATIAIESDDQGTTFTVTFKAFS